MKKLLSLLLIVITVLSFMVSCMPESGDVAAVKNANKLVVGVTVYPPMDYLDENYQWTGFDAELAMMFAESLGVNCQLVIIDWDNKTAELKTNQIDLVWNGMTATDKLAEQMDFSVSYAKNAQVAVVKKGSTLTADEVKNAKIAVEGGSAGATIAEETIGARMLRR